jgi:hypothetical protein
MKSRVISQVVVIAIVGIWMGCGDNSSLLTTETDLGGQSGAPATSETGGQPGGAGGTVVGGAGGIVVGGAGGTLGEGNPTTVVLRDGRITLMQWQPDHGLNGYGWVALAPRATLTSPTCNGSPITATAPCMSNMRWASDQGLCVSGSIPALSSTADYDQNWGIEVGVNATDPAGGGLGRSYNVIFIYTTGAPTTGIRLIVHRKGDPESITYCVAFSSGTRIPFTSFNTRCWDGSGTFLTEADVPTIDKMALLIASGETQVAVSELCFSSIYLQQ